MTEINNGIDGQYLVIWQFDLGGKTINLGGVSAIRGDWARVYLLQVSTI